MKTQNILFKRQLAINDYINIMIPTVGEVLDQEDNYYGIVTMLTAMPIDMMVQLDDIGIDFTTINEYELFLLCFGAIQAMDTSLVFGDLNLKDFERAVDVKTNQIILVDRTSKAVIDRVVHSQIASALRKIHSLERNLHKPGNKEAQDYMLKRAREKMRRQRNRRVDSQLESYIVALVNTPEFHYGFEGTQELSIYQFNQSLHQVIHKVDYEHRMHGIYSGTISAKEMSQDDLNWLKHK